MIKTNVPEEIWIDNGKEKYIIGDKIRILLNNHNEYIGEIQDIKYDNILLCLDNNNKIRIYIKDIFKIRYALVNENFKDNPYFDKNEINFWRTHWITKEGIVEEVDSHINNLKELLDHFNQKQICD